LCVHGAYDPAIEQSNLVDGGALEVHDPEGEGASVIRILSGKWAKALIYSKTAS
jgi:hypothetical protein